MKKVLSFQKEVTKNNNRAWFNANKSLYEESQAEFKAFVEDVAQEVSSHDLLDTGKTKIFRIYRDVRFSKDATPYTLHRSASFKRATQGLRGGYYLRIQPGSSAIAGGFWGPNAKDILHLRKQFQQNPDELREIISSVEVQNYFLGMEGVQVKSAPRGFSKEDPAIDLLRYKQLILRHDFSDKEILSPDFAYQVSQGFAKMRPFFDYMSDILATDLNGESMLE